MDAIGLLKPSINFLNSISTLRMSASIPEVLRTTPKDIIEFVRNRGKSEHGFLQILHLNLVVQKSGKSLELIVDFRPQPVP